ncbi:teneurin-m [Eurytemora carolleeae]|uniref:teneurin-m n=1 Tax=Eurytemora carolleeae TaxID=1294199 RepID=UPI000C77EBB1|nr:teneurin-m [Eurytemora carolleeae]|eukprot:XP_023328170.1 teneurin-m-like [Eurytemora affinis]
MKSPPSSPRPSSLKGSRTPSLKGSKCSWRSLAVIFIVLSLTMGATLVFLIASSSLTTEENEAAKACPVVDSSPSIQSNPGLESVLEPRNLPPDGSSFREIKLKDKMAVLVPPFGYLNLQFFHQESRKVSIEVWVPRGSSFALYARRNALPTHTKYNYILLISGSKDRQPRSAGRVQSSENLYLEEGHWFVSLYNDDGEPQPVEILLADSQGADGCGNDCNGHGDCKNGRCNCDPGFDGENCTESKFKELLTKFLKKIKCLSISDSVCPKDLLFEY